MRQEIAGRQLDHCVRPNNRTSGIVILKRVVFMDGRLIDACQAERVPSADDASLTPLDCAGHLGNVQNAHVADVQHHRLVARYQVRLLFDRVQAQASGGNVQQRRPQAV